MMLVLLLFTLEGPSILKLHRLFRSVGSLSFFRHFEVLGVSVAIMSVLVRYVNSAMK